jgi:lysophospholipase L1-like esterase
MIVGGTNSTLLAGQVQIHLPEALCVGSLIDTNWVLTAKHCFDETPNNADISIRAGSRKLYEGQEFGVSRIMKHDSADIALVQLTGHVRDPKWVIGYDDSGRPSNDQNVSIHGWGETADGNPADNLQVCTMRLADNRFEDPTTAPGDGTLLLEDIGVGHPAWGDSGAGVIMGHPRKVFGVVAAGIGDGDELAVSLNFEPGWIARVSGVAPHSSSDGDEDPPDGGPGTVSRLRVMPLGDSITDGFGSSAGNGYRAKLTRQLQDHGYQTDFVGSVRSGNLPDPEHEGHNGWEISQIADAARTYVPALRPSVVLIHAGTNDMNRNVDPTGAPGRLAQLVDQTLSDAPEATVLVATLVPASNGTVQNRIDEYNRQVRALVRARQETGRHVGLVDLAPITTSDLVDGLHPNDGGYDKMAEAFYTGIQLAALDGWLKEPGTTAPAGCPVRGGQWLPRGRIASGTGLDGRIHFADMDGDNRDDYLVLNADGAVDAWRNVGGDQNGSPGWISMGRIASGVGAAPSAVVHFADINGDRRDDYLVVGSQGEVDAWLNVGGDSPGRPGWVSQGRIASGVGDAAVGPVMFADINGDDRDDYLVVARNTAVTAWENVGGDREGAPGWIARGEIASGVGTAQDQVVFADVTCDRLDDYLILDTGGALDAWQNTGGDQPGRPGWVPMGQIASGGVGVTGATQLADINGDGLDDYLVVGGNGSVDAWINNGGDRP